MNISRRGFLKSCLALAVAPAVCKAENMMRIIVPQSAIIVPSQEMVLETWGAQIEQRGINDYIASVYFRKPGESGWKKHIIRTTATEQPKIRIRPDGTFEFTDHPTLSSTVTPQPIAPNGIASIRGRADQELVLGDPKGVLIGPDSPALCYHPPYDLPDRGWNFNAAMNNQRLLDGEWTIPERFKKKVVIG